MSSTTPIDPSEIGNETNASATPLGTPDFVIDGGGGVQFQFVVEEGPVWLARFLYDPPGWLAPVLYALLLAVLAVAVYKVVREGVDPEALREAANRAVFVTTIGLVAVAFNQSGLFPYAVDVVGTVVVGVGGARFIQTRPAWKELLEEFVPIES